MSLIEVFLLLGVIMSHVECLADHIAAPSDGFVGGHDIYLGNIFKVLALVTRLIILSLL